MSNQQQQEQASKQEMQQLQQQESASKQQQEEASKPQSDPQQQEQVSEQVIGGSLPSTPPTISSLPAGSHPAIPVGVKIACFTGPGTEYESPECPVLEWGEITFWPFSYDDNRDAMCIVAYDREGNVRRIVEALGARYVWKIGLDYDATTVTFWGQANQEAVVAWATLWG